VCVTDSLVNVSHTEEYIRDSYDSVPQAEGFVTPFEQYYTKTEECNAAADESDTAHDDSIPKPVISFRIDTTSVSPSSDFGAESSESV